MTTYTDPKFRRDWNRLTPTKNALARRDLMARRDAALKANDLPTFHQLTREIADLPMAGVKPLTQADKDRYNVFRADGRVVRCTVPE